jgi:16S rRNA (guanine(527)-N(7))-methyltransferase RsmG
VSFRTVLLREWSPFGVLSEAQVAALERHYEMLLRWNRVLNLTRVGDLEEIVRMHYCESLFLGVSLPPGAMEVADVGSGGGFPGVPLAVARPECRVTLIESDRRKAVFLREACAAVSNIAVFEGRAQEVRNRFDWVVSRAVSPGEILKLDLSPNVALLTSTAQLVNLRKPFCIINSPWGSHRVIAFHVKQSA